MKEVHIQGWFIQGTEIDGIYYPIRDTWLAVDSQDLKVDEIIKLFDQSRTYECKVAELNDKNRIKIKQI